MSRERRLGRGLEALLGRAGIEPAAPAARTDGSAALATKPAAGGLGSGAAKRHHVAGSLLPGAWMCRAAAQVAFCPGRSG